MKREIRGKRGEKTKKGGERKKEKKDLGWNEEKQLKKKATEKQRDLK